jgi:uncharacterized membrane protein
MFNLHPAFSSLPTALILLLLIFELINIKYPNKINQFTIEFTSFFCLLAVLLAFFSGYQGVDFVSERCMVPEEFISTHHNFGKTLMFLFIALVVLGFFARRSKQVSFMFLFFSFGISKQLRNIFNVLVCIDILIKCHQGVNPTDFILTNVLLEAFKIKQYAL